MPETNHIFQRRLEAVAGFASISIILDALPAGPVAQQWSSSRRVFCQHRYVTTPLFRTCLYLPAEQGRQAECTVRNPSFVARTRDSTRAQQTTGAHRSDRIDVRNKQPLPTSGGFLFNNRRCGRPKGVLSRIEIARSVNSKYRISIWERNSGCSPGSRYSTSAQVSSASNDRIAFAVSTVSGPKSFW